MAEAARSPETSEQKSNVSLERAGKKGSNNAPFKASILKGAEKKTGGTRRSIFTSTGKSGSERDEAEAQDALRERLRNNLFLVLGFTPVKNAERAAVHSSSERRCDAERTAEFKQSSSDRKDCQPRAKMAPADGDVRALFSPPLLLAWTTEL